MAWLIHLGSSLPPLPLTRTASKLASSLARRHLGKQLMLIMANNSLFVPFQSTGWCKNALEKSCFFCIWLRAQNIQEHNNYPGYLLSTKESHTKGCDDKSEQVGSSCAFPGQHWLLGEQGGWEEALPSVSITARQFPYPKWSVLFQNQVFIDWWGFAPWAFFWRASRREKAAAKQLLALLIKMGAKKSVLTHWRHCKPQKNKNPWLITLNEHLQWTPPCFV